MLADGGAIGPITEGLRIGLHLPASQFRKLVAFIASALPFWRDDSLRKPETAEDALSDQLCDFLNDAARSAPGLDAFKFQRETRDDSKGGRNLDIAAKPSGCSIWIGDRHYSPYDIFLPIECKRLPTPAAKKRDPREYLFSDTSSAGGVQRFKSGVHAANHAFAAMIGYVQDRDIPHWRQELGKWIDELSTTAAPLWSADDRLELGNHDASGRHAVLYSNHARANGLSDIAMNHLWIEM
ncbi:MULTISPECIES: hypothetical protein [Sphingomonas]|uniref:hypothetical protein n=1 Tax=Sphingomonas TaxID=13687 RepID=UPI000AB5DAE1|nr:MULTISPECIES: hypothetical protein [Sphingomonas]MBY0300138.1 hypothetical protein [Sphingomonas ginsenosidimutans]